MNEYCKNVLYEMYMDCIKNLGSKKEDSLILSMISRNSNTIKRAFLAASYDSGTTKSGVMNTLNEEGYVREVSPGKYILTARGIFYVEFKLHPLEVDHYIDWIDREFLQMDAGPISDKNRVILLSLFAARCFSEESCATYADTIHEKAFMDLLNDSDQFLTMQGIIKPGSLNFNSKSKSRISSILNQIDKLPSSTGMKFTAAGDKKYYLNVLNNGGIDRQSITFITKIIMGDNPSLRSIQELEEFCNRTYKKYGFVFSKFNLFDDAKSRFQIENGMEDAAS